METIGFRIARFRKFRGLTQEELAEIVGCAPRYIGHLERGNRQPGYEIIKRIARALNVTLADLDPDLSATDASPNARRAATTGQTSVPVAALEGAA